MKTNLGQTYDKPRTKKDLRRAATEGKHNFTNLRSNKKLLPAPGVKGMLGPSPLASISGVVLAILFVYNPG